MTTRTPLMAGNWKMNLDHHQATHTVQKLAWTLKDARHDFAAVEVVRAAPVHRPAQRADAGRRRQARAASTARRTSRRTTSGAYTGEISPLFLAKLGVTYVAIGHSERREYHDESDELVNAKVKSALGAGIIPILCVGEVLDVRKAGEHVPHTLAQLDGALAGLTAAQVATIVVAYEPVWAIGTGETATPEDAQELAAAIRARIAELYDAETADAVRVLYGGSVKSSNVASIMAKPDVDGALVGGASLDPEEFAAIARYKSHAVGL